MGGCTELRQSTISFRRLQKHENRIVIERLEFLSVARACHKWRCHIFLMSKRELENLSESWMYKKKKGTDDDEPRVSIAFAPGFANMMHAKMMKKFREAVCQEVVSDMISALEYVETGEA